MGNQQVFQLLKVSAGLIFQQIANPRRLMAFHEKQLPSRTCSGCLTLKVRDGLYVAIRLTMMSLLISLLFAATYKRNSSSANSTLIW